MKRPRRKWPVGLSRQGEDGESTAIETTNLYLDALVTCKIKSGSATSAGYVAVYARQTEVRITTLTNLSGVVRQLKKERDRVQQQLSGLNAAFEAFAGVYRGHDGTRPRRKMSTKGRARIAAAQRARWAKFRGHKVVPIAKPRRTMSASGRRKITAAQRARWARSSGRGRRLEVRLGRTRIIESFLREMHPTFIS